jgi:hypothetical protein
MAPKATSPFAMLRGDAEGIRASFEEFCCQLFRRAPNVPEKSRYRRIRGAGGDGGVEATWVYPDQKVWGLQAKFFGRLGSSEKAQLTESVRQAAANYPTLERYTICLPFNLTGNTGAKAGNQRQASTRRFHPGLANGRQYWPPKAVQSSSSFGTKANFSASWRRPILPVA